MVMNGKRGTVWLMEINYLVWLYNLNDYGRLGSIEENQGVLSEKL